MSDWVDIDAVSNLPEGSVSLAEGEVEDFEIECPRHGARFDLRTGKVTAPPAYEDVTPFAVRIHDGHVQVCDERNDN